MGRVVIKDSEDGSLRFFTVVNAGYVETDKLWIEVYDINDVGNLGIDTIEVSGISMLDSSAYLLQLMRQGYLDLSEYTFEYEDNQEE